MRTLVNYNQERIDDLERSGDRLHTMGIAQTVECQIDDLDFSESAKKVMRLCCSQMYVILQQAFFLEDELARTRASLRDEKRLNLALEIDNKDLQTKYAQQCKEIRSFKRSINELMEK